MDVDVCSCHKSGTNDGSVGFVGFVGNQMKLSDAKCQDTSVVFPKEVHTVSGRTLPYDVFVV